MKIKTGASGGKGQGRKLEEMHWKTPKRTIEVALLGKAN
jgi:hypothetical protein